MTFITSDDTQKNIIGRILSRPSEIKNVYNDVAANKPFIKYIRYEYQCNLKFPTNISWPTAKNVKAR